MDVPSVFAINGVTADFGNETLRDASGGPIELRPQCFAVLKHLFENRNRLVTKDELMRAVWPGTAVTDDSLVQCIHEIRRALNDESHAILKTVPRRGYRLVLDDDNPLPAATGTQAATPLPVETRKQAKAFPLAATVAGVLLLLAVAAGAAWWFLGTRSEGPPTIAVLPFDNLGADPGESYFADGITEDLITDLSKISGVLVIARTSVWPYKTKAATAGEIAADLGVRYVLEGSVRREGDAVRINAQLIDAVGDHHLWAERYDGKLSDVFALQDKVIANIVSALAVKLTDSETAEAANVETRNPEAYDALLRGLDHLRLDTEAETMKAIPILERAVALDPDYGRTWGALAAARLRVVLSYWWTTAGSGWDHAYRSLKSTLAKAMEKPTSLSWRVSAMLAVQEGRYAEAFDAIDRAKALAPNDPETLVVKARILCAVGRAEEAEAEIRLAMRLDPGYSPATMRALAMVLFHEQRYREAADTIERIKAQDAATTDDYIELVSALGHLGQKDRVQAAIDAYNALALPNAYDPLTVQESWWYWNNDLFSYHRPYVEKLVEGLRLAGVPEGAGVDLTVDDYRPLITRTAGEFDVDGATEIDAATAKALHDRGLPFIDVRAHVDYANGHVPGAANLSLAVDLSKETMAQVAKPDDEVVVYCHGKYCAYSAYASAKAVAWGYKRVYRFAGGFPAWEDAGYPVEKSDNPTAD